MKIGLIGFFGVDAFSDDMINYATQQIFKSFNPSLEFDSQAMWRCSKGGRTDVNYLNSFDLLILGGGSLLGKCTFFPVCDIQTWARKLTTPLCIFGTAYRYEPSEEPLSEERKQRLMTLFETSEVTMLRGQQSTFHCAENGIYPHLETYGDPLIGADFKKPDGLRNIIGGNVRNMPPNEIQDTGNDFVQEEMARIYDWLIKEKNLSVELYSFRNKLEDSDIEGAKKTMAHMKYKNRVSIRFFNSAIHAFEVIDTSFWCGQRLHPSIYAAVIGVPFVGVDTQFQKMWDFMTSINSENFINIKEGVEGFVQQYYRIAQEDYMKHVAIEVELNRQHIRRVAAKILEVGEKR